MYDVMSSHTHAHTYTHIQAGPSFTTLQHMRMFMTVCFGYLLPMVIYAALVTCLILLQNTWAWYYTHTHSHTHTHTQTSTHTHIYICTHIAWTKRTANHWRISLTLKSHVGCLHFRMRCVCVCDFLCLCVCACVCVYVYHKGYVSHSCLYVHRWALSPSIC